jgi:hypothetical protein
MASGNLPTAIAQAPDLATQAQMLNGQVSRQASMIAYLGNFRILAFLLLAIAPFPFLLKRSNLVKGPTDHMAME